MNDTVIYLLRLYYRDRQLDHVLSAIDWLCLLGIVLQFGSAIYTVAFVGDTWLLSPLMLVTFACWFVCKLRLEDSLRRAVPAVVKARLDLLDVLALTGGVTPAQAEALAETIKNDTLPGAAAVQRARSRLPAWLLTYQDRLVAQQLERVCGCAEA